MYYPCSENKGADQLRSYCEADLRLCFRLCRLLVFPCGGSYFLLLYSLVYVGPGRKPRLFVFTRECSFTFNNSCVFKPLYQGMSKSTGRFIQRHSVGC